MKTKITSLLLAAAMTAGLLAGCGSATSSSGSTAETGDMQDFDGVVRTFELMNSYLKWKERGRLLVPNVNLPGDITGTGASAAAEKLGRSR